MFGNRRESDKVQETVARSVADTLSGARRVDPVTVIALHLRGLTYEDFVSFADELAEHLKDTTRSVDVAIHEWAKARTAKMSAPKEAPAPAPAPTPAPAPVSAAAQAAADNAPVSAEGS